MDAGCVVMPGAINALSARLIEREGFDALYISGAVMANSVIGKPDVGMTTLTEAELHCSNISRVTTIPAIADADTGYGEADNAARTVEIMEQAGIAGVHIEDQVFPKRCGHLAGKELVPADEFCIKIEAAANGKRSSDFVLVARTDARGVEGFDAAVRRAKLYLDAGADAIFPEGLRSEAEFEQFAREVDSYLLANMTEFGTTPYITADRFKAMGYNMVIFPVTLQRAAMKAMEDVLRTIKQTGSQESVLNRMQTRQELYSLLEYDAKVDKPV